VERVILRCLERRPGERPASALAVAAALPGGDPLAAALAAGDTPSPEMVADAGAVGGMRPAIGVVCLAGILLGLAIVVALADRATLVNLVPLPKPPGRLAVEAGAIARMAGYEETAVDTGYGLSIDGDYFRYVEERDESSERWDDLDTVRPGPIYFWYRESPRHLVPWGWANLVSVVDPPSRISGMVDVHLDPGGRLLHFQAVPPQFDDTVAEWDVPDWTGFFESAGLDPSTFAPAGVHWSPLVERDARWAWVGSYPERPGVPVRVEAGSFHGRPVDFAVIAPWTRPDRMEPAGGDGPPPVLLFIFFGGMIGGVLLARRNLRLGRSDRRGAFRLALFMFACGMLGWLFRAEHVPAIGELRMFFSALALALMVAGIGWLVYTALEPYVRRLWPDVLISWSRLIDGRFRDPLIGRDILIGGLLGVVLAHLQSLGTLAPAWLGHPAPVPEAWRGAPLDSLRDAIGAWFRLLMATPIYPVGVLLVVLLLRMVLRRDWLAVVALVALITFGWSLSQATWVALVIGILFTTTILVSLIRFGLFAAMVAFLFSNWDLFVVTSDLSAWYAGQSMLTLALFAALAVYGFWISLAGRPLFKDALLPD